MSKTKKAWAYNRKFPDVKLAKALHMSHSREFFSRFLHLFKDIKIKPYLNLTTDLEEKEEGGWGSKIQTE